MNRHDPEFLTQIEQSGLKSVYFGPQGFALPMSQQELEEIQLGFSVDSDGNSLVSDTPGQWQPQWRVIALDTEMGDPYFVDVESPDLAVFTAFFTGQHWEVNSVSQSFRDFLRCLQHIAQTAPQSQVMFVPDSTNLGDDTALTALEQELGTMSVHPSFWQEFFVCYRDWLRED